MKRLILLFVCLAGSLSAARAQQATTNGKARIIDFTLVLEGPEQIINGVNTGLYGPRTSICVRDSNRGELPTADTLTLLLEKELSLALQTTLQRTQYDNSPSAFRPGRALMSLPGMTGGNPRSYRIIALPDEVTPVNAFRADPALDWGIVIHARAYRELGPGAKDITNLQQTEFYELNLRIDIYDRNGKLRASSDAKAVRGPGVKVSRRIMGVRKSDSSISGFELAQLFHAALPKALKSLRVR